MKEANTDISQAQFSVGELVTHRLFHYRGVVIDVDASFQLTDEWYDIVAQSQPPRNLPWYHVLVHQAQHTTYVAERNLETDPSNEAIAHPLLTSYFTHLEAGRYIIDAKIN
jgi:heat shock protein HspQ